MTRLQALDRNQIARDAINSVLRDGLRSPPPSSWSVSARDNHSGEPALYVSVEMPAETDIPKVSDRNRLIAGMMSALERIGDDRFPYLYFGPRADEASLDDEEPTYDGDKDSF